MVRTLFILLVTMACRTSLIHAHHKMICYAGTEPDHTGKVRWVLPYSDPCSCTEIRPGGHNTQAPTRTFTPRYLKSLVITKDRQYIQSLLSCKSPPIVCENKEFTINCGDGETISVKWALYGFDADSTHRCFVNAVHCAGNDDDTSLEKVKTECQGKRHALSPQLMSGMDQTLVKTLGSTST
ncbi:uncharacterized protein LOC117303530 [Asterias rubens]|uniref:uncharacterized protein LOC117303530 n=1 Tax=Asterias rubens TaxID=7604 RepID=UPI0014558A38|nr:uncharacterized protein LOC117303530 [Asterias rubens]